ncbi:DUF6457 domain-containing protein [Actinoplanes regularis]|uniref:DUF6457 domain-containing protein n=1 Tax=Actinoplanes regularis TaxID=52697 RepID=UPI0024A3BF79|nr:DUF6457 domain-containing protein [Actinoplanes regularis]GLW29954.1 hypothetical protein Areg01_28940 [Actinoplanes regularis]
MSDLDRWVAAAGAELGVSPQDVPVEAILDVAREVAHNVVRPGAPVTAYLMGLAAARGADPADLAERITTLALSWADQGRDETTGN